MFLAFKKPLIHGNTMQHREWLPHSSAHIFAYKEGVVIAINCVAGKHNYYYNLFQL